ncbi:MAG: AraC family transcriptional regulator [Lachnospiraceae bacterium]|nr:AraC family transcriptional regulator [Lachnospiraceae bacterium]
MKYSEDSIEGIYVEKKVRIPSFAMTYDHSHIYCEIFYLKSGSCLYTLNDTTYNLTEGDIFIVAPGDSHSTRYEGIVPCERIVVYCEIEVIPQKFFDQNPDIFEAVYRSGKVILLNRGRLQLESIFNRMIEESNFPDEYSHQFLIFQTLELLLGIKRSGIFVYEKPVVTHGLSSDIENAYRYIAINYAVPLTLEEVAKNINLSPTYLSRKFKKVAGITFKEYITYVRIKQACQALLTTDDSITKIAFDCGFNSSNYFKDVFRRINGVSPRTFRSNSKGNELGKIAL